MRSKSQARCQLACSSIYLLASACLLCLYAALTFSTERQFHCCQPAGLSFAQLSVLALLLPLLLALSGVFGWASLRTGRVAATLPHLLALALLAVHAALLGTGAFTWRDSVVLVLERNFQLVRDCRTDWLVERLQEGMGCNGWNRTTAGRSVCARGSFNGSSSGVGPCRERVTQLTGQAAGLALAFGLAIAASALISLGCQCSYQWKISDPSSAAATRRKWQQRRQAAAAPSVKVATKAEAEAPAAVPLMARARRLQPPVRRPPPPPPPPPPMVVVDAEDDGAV